MDIQEGCGGKEVTVHEVETDIGRSGGWEKTRNEIFTRAQKDCIAEFSLLCSFQSPFSDTPFLYLFSCNVGRTRETGFRSVPLHCIGHVY